MPMSRRNRTRSDDPSIDEKDIVDRVITAPSTDTSKDVLLTLVVDNSPGGRMS
jgi:hypothetical protein